MKNFVPVGGAPLTVIADIPLPGAAKRFDYQTFDPTTGRLYISHMYGNQAGVNLGRGLADPYVPLLAVNATGIDADQPVERAEPDRGGAERDQTEPAPRGVRADEHERQQRDADHEPDQPVEVGFVLRPRQPHVLCLEYPADRARIEGLHLTTVETVLDAPLAFGAHQLNWHPQRLREDESGVIVEITPALAGWESRIFSSTNHINPRSLA